MALDATHRDAAMAELDRLMQRHPGFQVAALALRDGRPFVQRHRGDVDANKLAAMSSALVALGSTVLAELAAGTLDHVLVDGQHGKLVLVRLPERAGLVILALLANAEALPGLVLGQARTCAVAVGGILMRASLSIDRTGPAASAPAGLSAAV